MHTFETHMYFRIQAKSTGKSFVPQGFTDYQVGMQQALLGPGKQIR